MEWVVIHYWLETSYNLYLKNMIVKVEVNYFSFHCSAEQNLMSFAHSASYDIDRIMREMIVKTKYISNSGTSLCIQSSIVFLTCLQILETMHWQLFFFFFSELFCRSVCIANPLKYRDGVSQVSGLLLGLEGRDSVASQDLVCLWFSILKILSPMGAKCSHDHSPL